MLVPPHLLTLKYAVAALKMGSTESPCLVDGGDTVVTAPGSWYHSLVPEVSRDLRGGVAVTGRMTQEFYVHTPFLPIYAIVFFKHTKCQTVL